jgi:hypothetical protein
MSGSTTPYCSSVRSMLCFSCLREGLGDLVGVSEEFLERIDRVSPGGDGPIFRYLKDVMLYERLVLLALAESTLARQQVDSM